MGRIKAVMFDLGDTIIVEADTLADIDTTEFEIIDGAMDVLETLKGQFKLAIVSNTFTWGDREITMALEGYDLAKYFDQIVTSVDADCRKPADCIFRKAMKLLNILPQETVMVGDRIDTDIVGANLMGITSILCRWNERYPAITRDEHDLPDYIISSIRELPMLLSWLNEQER